MINQDKPRLSLQTVCNNRPDRFIEKTVSAKVKRGKMAAAILAVCALAGCSGIEPGVLMLSGATATVISTDKLPTDFIADAVTGLDCNSIRQSREGGPFCQSVYAGTVIEKPLYCYKSLGEVTCYEKPDPYKDGRQHIRR